MDYSYQYSNSSDERFTNEPLSDFVLPSVRESFTESLKKLESERLTNGLKACPIINGNERSTEDKTVRIDPCDTSITLGSIFFASKLDIKDAYESFKNDNNSWAKSRWENRIKLLLNTAKILRENRGELTSLLIREVGKPWKDADAEVAEAIDFCEYYALCAKKLSSDNSINLPGEANTITNIPRGISAVIAPWNFPLAILAGMTVASLVTGNYTVIKPAEQSSLIGFRFAKILLEAGFPKNSFAFLPGRGEVIGDSLVRHPETSIICFTGSREVGVKIMELANQLIPGQSQFKKVIAELGSKNPIILDSDADLDSALPGVISSAFGFAGQKCSACSRIIIVGRNYEKTLQRISKATNLLEVGSSVNSSTEVGPLVDSESLQRVEQILEKLNSEGKKPYFQLERGQFTSNKGNFLPPTIFDNVSDDSILWRKELFAPVIAVANVKKFSDAIYLANDIDYALTASVYSRNPEHIKLAKSNMQVGNLYINRGCTGAIVGRQPFGGRKLSGSGFKAGGEHYLLQFINQMSITENTMRKGYTPEL